MTRALVLMLSIAACGFAALAAAAPAPTSQPAQPARPQNYSDRYSILSQRNIFLKDRSRGSSGSRNGDGRNDSSTQPSPQPARKPIEESMILTGIVEEDGEFRAYVEDQLNSAILRVSTGDRLARGKVVRIGLDSIEYEQTGGGNSGSGAATTTAPASPHRTMVAIGSDLTGREVAFSLGAYSASAADGSASAGATTGPVMPSGVEGLNPNDPSLTMEQRLKLRRMQELKK